MSNNIKKGLVLLSLALVCISGSAARPSEHAQNREQEAKNVPKPTMGQQQLNPDYYSYDAGEILSSGAPSKWKNHKDNPGNPGRAPN